MNATTPAVADLSFEEALAELKSLVERLESGQGKLDDAIAAYERGSQLRAHCEAKLRDAQLKIEKITAGGAAPSSEPFEAS